MPYIFNPLSGNFDFTNAAGGGVGGSGTVTSVNLSTPIGLSVTGGPITLAGVLALSYTAGYSIPTTASQANWATAFSQTRQWDGSATGLVAATGRTSLGLGTAALSLSSDFAPSSHPGTGGTAHANVVAAGAAGFMIGADKTKLDGIATAATANSADATLLNRANHTGTDTTAALSDFASATRAQTESELVAGTNVTITPSSTGATRQLTIAATSGGGGSLTVQDEGVTLSAAVTSINFTGAGVTATGTTGVTVAVPGGTASAGGSTTQVQYNSAGALAGATNVGVNTNNLQLVAPGSTPGAASASSLVVYPVSLAERYMAAMVGPIGPASLLQPSVFNNNILMWSPQSGTTGTGGGVFHGAWTSNGSPSHPAVTNATLSTRYRATWYSQTTTAANQQMGPRFNTTTEMCFHRGAVDGQGGFFYFSRFSPGNVGAGPTTVRLFSGLQGAGATSSVCISDTVINNVCGLWRDLTDPASGVGAFNFVTRDTVTTTKTTINLVNAIAVNNVYDFYMYCPPASSTIYFRLDDLNNSASYTAAVTATLPTASVMMSPQCQMSNGTANVTAFQTALLLYRIYVESPYE